MKHKHHQSITLIDGLAEITRHHDRKMLERSVLKTINDLFPAENLHLFLLNGLNEDKPLKLIVLVDKKGGIYLGHNAMMAFDRLRQNIDKHEFPQVGNVAISIGFVEVAGQLSATDVIGMADDALYYAKFNGRNQTVSYKELLAQGKIAITEHIDNSHADIFID